jgi:prepilin-type N-terminal cleavage/methylation domain-containing protein
MRTFAPVCRGFTLVEMLVVLIIVGMTTTLLFQMLSQTFRMQHVAGIQIADTRQGAMEADWLRQVVNGLQPDYIDGKNIFKGTARKITGLSDNPLTADYGAPEVIALELVFDPDSGFTRLFYGKPEDGTVLMAWKNDTGRFVFADANGDTHDAWPPPLNKWPQLPASIRLEFEQEGTPKVIVATPKGPPEPMPRVRDVIGIVG